MPERILVIRLGALGDIVLCFEAFQAIRGAHPKAEIALLTMPIYAEFVRKMPWFDRVLIDRRLPRWRLDGWIDLARQVKAFAPTRVYDLQAKSRQTILYGLLKGPFGPEWSGAALFCSHPRPWPPKPNMHFTDHVAAQLERAGVTKPKKIDLNWLDASVDKFNLPEKFALLIPGCAPGREYKRWPAYRYAELAMRLKEKGIFSAAIGTSADEQVIRELCIREESVIDLCNRTSLLEVAALARRAEFVIGNDTGPTHLAAAVGAITLALMSSKVDPVWSAPKGPRAKWLQGHLLRDLDIKTVFADLGKLYPSLR